MSILALVNESIVDRVIKIKDKNYFRLYFGTLANRSYISYLFGLLEKGLLHKLNIREVTNTILNHSDWSETNYNKTDTVLGLYRSNDIDNIIYVLNKVEDNNEYVSRLIGSYGYNEVSEIPLVNILTKVRGVNPNKLFESIYVTSWNSDEYAFLVNLLVKLYVDKINFNKVLNSPNVRAKLKI